MTMFVSKKLIRGGGKDGQNVVVLAPFWVKPDTRHKSGCWIFSQVTLDFNELDLPI